MVFTTDFVLKLAFVFVAVSAIFQLLHRKWMISLIVALLFVSIAAIDKTIVVYIGEMQSYLFDIVLILICLLSLWKLKKPV